MAPTMEFKIKNFVTREVDAVKSILEALNTLRELRREAVALGYTSTITQDDLPDTGNLAHLTPADLAAGFAAVAAIETAIDGTHLTNLYKLVP